MYPWQIRTQKRDRLIERKTTLEARLQGYSANYAEALKEEDEFLRGYNLGIVSYIRTDINEVLEELEEYADLEDN